MIKLQWKDVDQTKLMDTKLRCAFEHPADAANENDLNVGHEEKHGYKNESVKSTSRKVRASIIYYIFNLITATISNQVVIFHFSYFQHPTHCKYLNPHQLNNCIIDYYKQYEY